VTRIAIIGTGYVGLSTGACFSYLGHDVTCVDTDTEKISTLSSGSIPFVENGLEDLVRSGLVKGNLRFTTSREEAVSKADFVFLCLPTPQGDDGSADLSYVKNEALKLGPLLSVGAVVVNKSTVPVGTGASVTKIIGRSDIAVISNPEFLRQGTAVHDFLNPSRIVIGGENADAVNQVSLLYCDIEAPIMRMRTASAEALKYAANAFLATKLTFINAMADICEAVGADIFDVSSGIGLDPRIGQDMLRAGPGWGGSCFPKDTRALVKIAAEGGYDFALLRGVIETNDQHYARIAEKVVAQCEGSVRGLKIAAWGLTFKANTDDLRDSPAIKILRMLHDYGAEIHAYDPTATQNYDLYPWIQIAGSALDACKDADALVLLTEWSEFADLDSLEVAKRMKVARVVDSRNVLNKNKWIAAGFVHRGVGR
jgi:UDPglucose 6-dehydrogenase